MNEFVTCSRCAADVTSALAITDQGKIYCRRCWVKKTNPAVTPGLDERPKKIRPNIHDD